MIPNWSNLHAYSGFLGRLNIPYLVPRKFMVGFFIELNEKTNKLPVKKFAVHDEAILRT